jgi:hypothetical protein
MLFSGAVVFATAFAVATTVLSYLTAESVALPACAGRDILLDHRVGAMDLIVLPLFSVGYLAVLIKVARSKKIIEEIERYDLTVFETSTVRVSYGVFVAGIACLVFVAVSGLTAEKSLTRYRQVSEYCNARPESMQVGWPKVVSGIFLLGRRQEHS